MKSYLILEGNKKRDYKRISINVRTRKDKSRGSILNDYYCVSGLRYKTEFDIRQMMTISYSAMILADQMISEVRSSKEYVKWDNQRNKARAINSYLHEKYDDMRERIRERDRLSFSNSSVRV